MKIEVLENSDSVARRGAEIIAAEARSKVTILGRFVMAVSGGTTPWIMLRAPAAMELPWSGVHIVQVDERVAPNGHPDRNLTHLLASLAGSPIPAGNIHPMPVNEDDLNAAAGRYAAELQQLLGPAGVLDLCHLGLGPDGHTASLVPGDPVLDVRDRDVAITGVYQGRKRMTLTYPVLNRAESILWIVTGEGKRDALTKLQAGDHSIPAGRVVSDRAMILADRAAEGLLT